MLEAWNRQRVMELAPDSASAKAGAGLGNRSKWITLGHATTTVWGEITGSGSKPYQVRIDLREPAFKCSCPSRKFPCKHAIGLMLVVAEQADAVVAAEPPEWVADWLAQRDQRTEKRQQRAEDKAAKTVDAKAQEERATKHDKRIRAGIEETALWLSDVLRGGLAAAQAQPGSYWETAAARLVDAQAPGLARHVRHMRDQIGSGNGWQERLLEAVGRLYLLLGAYRRLDELAADLQAEVRAAVGLTLNKDELIATMPPVAGEWLVVGQTVEEEENLQVQRTWLLRRGGEPQSAMVLDFAAGTRPLDTSLLVGTTFCGEVVFYPGCCPLRAVVKQREGGIASADGFAGVAPDAALASYSRALAATPWLERWPMALADVSLHYAAQSWMLRSSKGHELPIDAGFKAGWTAMSVTAGRPCRVFGEWNGQGLLPLAIATASGFFAMSKRTATGRLTRVAA